MLTHWKKLDNPDYLGAYAFQPNETKTVTIRTVTRETITGADGKKEDCTLVHFDGGVKPMILNATNGKMIQKVLSTPYTEEWAGRQVVLGVERVKAFGDVVDAVRVKNRKVAAADKPAAPVLCADCGKTIEASGSWSAETIVDSSSRKYGVALCMSCAKARKEKEAADDAKHPDQDQ